MKGNGRIFKNEGTRRTRERSGKKARKTITKANEHRVIVRGRSVKGRT